jgi:hypothetical protein
LLGWVKPVISIPLILISLYCLISCFKDSAETLSGIFDRKKLIIIICILLIWVILSGIGGFVWQNGWDHKFRNAIFKDLFYYKWPVVNHEEGANLCYYFGYWLPSAWIAKLFNSLSIGYLFQLIWGFSGVLLSFLLITQWLQKLSYKTLILLILFSGLDFILLLILQRPDATELWAIYFSHSCNSLFGV